MYVSFTNYNIIYIPRCLRIRFTWDSSHQVAHPPAEPKEVGLGDVDTDGVAEPVAEVDAPVEDPGGGTTLSTQH
jgi:hypothetical protein